MLLKLKGDIPVILQNANIKCSLDGGSKSRNPGVNPDFASLHPGYILNDFSKPSILNDYGYIGYD